MGPVVAGVLTAAGLLFSLVVATRRPTPAVPLALLAVAAPVLTFALYQQPFSAALFTVLVVAGLAAGVALQRAARGLGPGWAHPARLTLVLRAAWSAAFLWAQSAELGGSFDTFRIGVALFGLAGGALAGYAIVSRVHPMVALVMQPEYAGASVDRQPMPAGPGSPSPTAPAWSPSHAVPGEGLPAWSSPDPAAPVAARLAAGLPLAVIATSGDWAEVEGSNGWIGWVDGRRLVRLA